MSTSLRRFLRRYPALGYFVLTFAISWGGVFLVAAATGSPDTPEAMLRMVPIWGAVLVAGPAISGILLTRIVHGREGLRAFRSRLLCWRVGARWYAIALLAAPAYYVAVLLAMSAGSSEFLPGLFAAEDPAPLAIQALAVGLLAGVFEELGWTGFATPALRRNHGVVATGLVIGVLWGVWHFLVKIWAADALGLGPFLVADLGAAVLGLTAFRIVIVWIHDRTGSLLLAMLAHVGLTWSTVALGTAATGRSLATANLVLSVGWWVVLGAIAVTLADRRRATRAAAARAPVA